MIVDAYFVTQGNTFAGTLDEWGDIIVCGTSYVGFGGTKLNFVDRRGDQHSICDILVDQRDFEQIADALLKNEVEIGPAGVDREPDFSI